MNAPWVFAEAYKYRRLRECFSVSKYWKDYDVFFRQKVRERITTFASVELNRSSKCDTFSRSQDAVFELSMRFAEASVLPPGLDEQAAAEKEHLMFHELTQSPSPRFRTKSAPGRLTTSDSLSVGKFDGPFVAYRHVRGADQKSPVDWGCPSSRYREEYPWKPSSAIVGHGENPQGHGRR